jgi:hypothetical protein
MQYKTIVLELLQQRTEMYEQLRQERKLLLTLERLAYELKTLHEDWKEILSQEIPGRQESQIASEALELALKEVEDSLPPASIANEEEALSLDQAMAFLNHTPKG